MRESRFIEHNKEKWGKYEKGIQSDSLGAEQMEEAFLELNDDLAYARTFYKNRAIRLFLNNLLLPIYAKINTSRKASFKSMAHFFTEIAPSNFYSARHFMLVSLITVLLGFSIGLLGTRASPEFAHTILGSNYVRMTEENIAKGDPLAVYKKEKPSSMFTYIALNNLKVAAFFFILGSLFCVGALYLLLSNGIMLGAFTWLFVSRGLASEYVLTVYQHGALEMLSMVIEGAAGLMLGAGILFPGTLTRTRSIQNAAKKSVLMFLVCVPIIVLAAFIESYLTRFTQIPTAMRSMVIILSVLFMLYYFVLLPIIKFRKNKKVEGNYDQLKPESQLRPKLGEIYSINTIILFGFDFIKRNIPLLSVVSLISLLLLYPLNQWLTENAISNDLAGRYLLIFSDINSFISSLKGISNLFFFNNYASCYLFSVNVHPWIVVNSAFLIAAIYLIILIKNRELWRQEGVKNPGWFQYIMASVFPAIGVALVSYFAGSAWWFFILFTLPLGIFVGGIYLLENDRNLISSFLYAIKLFFASFGKVLGNSFTLLLLHFMFMFGSLYLFAVLISISQQFHGLEFLSENTMQLFVWLNYLVMPLMIALAVSNGLYLLLSVHEANTGRMLNKRIQNMVFKKEYFGLESE